MTYAAISLGSNVGNRIEHLREAVRRVAEFASLERVSKVYQTAPMYYEDQPSFLNAAVLVGSNLGPWPLLEMLKQTEHDMGREQRTKNGPREIDLDLIFYGSLTYRFSCGKALRLILPHPRASERRFVLQPLFDLAPDLELPEQGKVADLLAVTELQSQSVHELSDALLPILCH